MKMIPPKGNDKEKGNIAGQSVKILGTGCARCNQLEESTVEALKQLGMESTVEHVDDLGQIAAYGVMMLPAIVIDGKVASYGKVLKTDEIVRLIKKVRGL